MNGKIKINKYTRYANRQIHTQPNRQRDIWTDGQVDIQTDRHITNTQIDKKKNNRQLDSQTIRQLGR